MIDKYLSPKLGKKKLSELEYEDFTAITNKLAPSEKSHTLAVARTFLRWCVKPPRRYTSHSPLEGVAIASGKARKRILKPREQKRVWDAATVAGYPYGTIVHLLIPTGQRKSEIPNLRRMWINPQTRTITLPEWVRKNSREHTFPYGDMVVAELEAVPIRNCTDLLFPSIVSDERPIPGWSNYKKRLGDGVPAWRLHDLRRTFGTMLAEMKVAPYVVRIPMISPGKSPLWEHFFGKRMRGPAWRGIRTYATLLPASGARSSQGQNQSGDLTSC